MILNLEQKRTEVNEFLNSFGYSIFNDKYVGAKDRINMVDSFGYKYYTTYDIARNTFKSGHNIAIFSVSNPYTPDNIRLWITVNNKPFRYISGEYLGTKNKNLIFKCDHCFNEWESCWSNIQIGRGCPICNKSKGESYIANFLKCFKIDYLPQHRFADCRNIIPLPFDFYLPQHNVCIEFNGRQHYEQVEAFGGEEAFKSVQINDQIKADYCLKNNIYLLIIPFWKMANIKNIIEKTIFPLGKEDNKIE